MKTRQVAVTLVRKIGEAALFSTTWILVSKLFKLVGWL